MQVERSGEGWQVAEIQRSKETLRHLRRQLQEVEASLSAAMAKSAEAAALARAEAEISGQPRLMRVDKAAEWLGWISEAGLRDYAFNPDGKYDWAQRFLHRPGPRTLLVDVRGLEAAICRGEGEYAQTPRRR